MHHGETIHKEVHYSCEICDYMSTKKGGLLQRVRTVHQGIKDACDLCEHKTSSNGILTLHVISIHEWIAQECDSKIKNEKRSHNRLLSPFQTRSTSTSSRTGTSLGRKRPRMKLLITNKAQLISLGCSNGQLGPETCKLFFCSDIIFNLNVSHSE
jgi:hypothetical protein